MYQRLKNYREVPPKFYRYTVPETGHYIEAWNIDNWIEQIRKHLEANNIPIPTDLLAKAEDQLCQLLPPGWCDFDDPNRPRVDTNFGWGDVERASATFVDWVSQGRETVTQDEAERRARICTRCYLNLRTQGCGVSCRELIRKLVGLFVNKKTSVDDNLHTCGACRCFLKAKVHFPLQIIEEHDTDSIQMLLPDFCWMKRGGVNYKP